MQFNPSNLITSLSYLVSGWLGVFIVIGIIILITLLLNKITAPKDDHPEQK